MEFDSFNPCLVIVFEGLFGTIYSIMSFFVRDIDAKILICIRAAKNSLAVFIILFFLIFVFSGIVNIYRVYINKVYNPMTQSLAYYCLDPFFMIYDFAAGNDFITFQTRNYFHFFLNLILSFIISITGFVFNEFIVLIWCGLERDTYQEISRRSICDKKEFELDIILKDEDIEEEMEENKEDKENKVTIYV